MHTLVVYMYIPSTIPSSLPPFSLAEKTVQTHYNKIKDLR